MHSYSVKMVMYNTKSCLLRQDCHTTLQCLETPSKLSDLASKEVSSTLSNVEELKKPP